MDHSGQSFQMWHLRTLEGSHFRFDTCAPWWVVFSDVASMDLSGQSFQMWHLWTLVGSHFRCDTCVPWWAVTSDVAAMDLSGRSLQMWLPWNTVCSHSWCSTSGPRCAFALDCFCCPTPQLSQHRSVSFLVAHVQKVSTAKVWTYWEDNAESRWFTLTKQKPGYIKGSLGFCIPLLLYLWKKIGQNFLQKLF